MNVFDVSARIALDAREYVSSLNEASAESNKFGSSIKESFSSAMQKGAAALNLVTTEAINLSSTLMKSVGDLAVYGDHIDKQSQKMNMSAQAYQEWDAIMQHSGTSIDSMQMGMRTLANAAESGNAAFAALGMSLEEVQSMSSEDLFAATITALQNVEDDTKRTYLASQLLGRGATELGALLNTSAEDTEKMRQRVHELGGVMSDEAVKASAAYQDSLQDMKTSMTGLTRGMTSNFLPSFTQVMDGLTNVFANEEGGVEKIAAGIDGIVGNLGSAATKLKPIISQIGSATISVIKENAPKLIKEGSRLLGKVVTSTVKDLPKMLNTIGSMFGVDLSSFSWIKDTVEKVFGTFNDLAGKINFKGLLDSAESIIEPLSKYWEKLGDGVSWLSENVISPVIEWGMNDALPKVFEGVAASFDVLRGAIEFLETPAKAIWEEFLQPLGSIAGDVIEGSLDLISKGLNGIADAVEGVDWEGYWFDIFEGKFGEDWALGWDEIKNNIEDAGDSIEEFFDTPDEEGWGKKWRTFWEDAGGAVYDFKSHIDKEIENTTEILGNFFDGVKKAKDDGAGFIEYMGDVIEGRDYKLNSTFEWDSGEFWEETYGIDPSKLQKQQVIESRQKKRIEAAKEAGRAEAEAKRIEAAKQAGKAEANTGSMVGSVLNALSGFRKMARGGVIVGEAGREAVVPLENNTQWTGKVADEVVDRMSRRSAGSSGMVVQSLTINMQGMEISSDYGTQRFIEKLSEQLKVYQNTQIRGVGGVGY